MSNEIVLLSGTKVVLSELPQSVVLPESLDVPVGEVVNVVNETGEFIGVATVTKSTVENFSLLQREHFSNHAHPDMGSWHGAFETLSSLVDGFSQNDKVTVLELKFIAVTDSGVTVSRAKEPFEPLVAPMDDETALSEAIEEFSNE